MKHLIKSKNAAPALRITLQQGEYVIASPARLIAANDKIRIMPLQKSGMLRNWAEKLQGKALALDTIQAIHDDTWILLSTPPQTGLMTIDFFAGTTHQTMIFIREKSLLAASSDLVPETITARDIRNISEILQANLISLRGTGPAFITGHGAIEHILLQDDRDIYIDAAHLVAWEQHITCTAVKSGVLSLLNHAAAGWEEHKTLLRLQGNGSVWVQTRAITSD